MMILPCASTSWATSTRTRAPGLSFLPFSPPVNSATPYAVSALAESVLLLLSAAGSCSMPHDDLGRPNTADTTAKTTVTVKVKIEQRFMFHPYSETGEGPLVGLPLFCANLRRT